MSQKCSQLKGCIFQQFTFRGLLHSSAVPWRNTPSKDNLDCCQGKDSNSRQCFWGKANFCQCSDGDFHVESLKTNHWHFHYATMTHKTNFTYVLFRAKLQRWGGSPQLWTPRNQIQTSSHPPFKKLYNQKQWYHSRSWSWKFNLF